MVNILRKYQQGILIAVTCVIIITFIWYWNGSQGGRASLGGATKRASLYGQPITDVDIQKQVHRFQLASTLGLDDLLEAFAGDAKSQQEALENFVWNSYVFDHEADTLQVTATDKQVQDALLQVRGLQTDGHFDSNKLQEIVANTLPSLGFTDSVIDDLVRQQVRVQKMRALIAGAVTISPAELDNRFSVENEKMDVSVVRLNLSDLQKSINPSDAQVKAQYDQHKDIYRSPEQRKVLIASFNLSDADQKLTGKDRTAALEKLGTDAFNFQQSAAAPNADFSALAARTGAKLQASGFFTASQPDPAFSQIPSLADATFKTSKAYPNSDIIEGENGYYVIHLQDVMPSRQLTFDEAKPLITSQLQTQGAKQILQTRANEARDRILAALKAGKSFSEAAISAGLSAESIPPFALVDSRNIDSPDLQQIVENAVTLSPGQLGDFTETQAGGLFVYMNHRTPVAKLAAVIGKAVQKTELSSEKQIEAFNEWLRLGKEAAHLEIVQG